MLPITLWIIFFSFLNATFQQPEKIDTIKSIHQGTAITMTVTNNIHIAWDHKSLSRVAANGGYARMIELNNKKLFCVYETNGNIACTKSADEGKTWSKPVIIVSRRNKVNMSTPDVIELQDESILVAYNPRPQGQNGDTGKHYAIRIIKSVDGGVSWKNDRLLYQAGYLFKNGCWEPALVQLPNGEIQLFFSDEDPYIHSNEQNISLLRSEDNGKTWTTKPEIACFTPGHRDGMPVPLILPEKKKIFFSIEDNVSGQFKPYIISNTFEQNWQKTVRADSPDRDYALKDSLPDSIYAGAPYLARLKTGETILSFQSTEDRSSQWNLSAMNVAIGDADGQHFTNISLPFNIPLGKHGLWNSLTVTDNNTVVAITTTNAYSDHNEVWMIKGHVMYNK